MVPTSFNQYLLCFISFYTRIGGCTHYCLFLDKLDPPIEISRMNTGTHATNGAKILRNSCVRNLRQDCTQRYPCALLNNGRLFHPELRLSKNII